MSQGMTGDGGGGGGYKPPTRGLAGPKQLRDLYEAIVGDEVLNLAPGPHAHSFHREITSEIDTPRGGGGYYNAKSFGVPVKPGDSSADATTAVLGPQSAATNVVYLFLPEIGTSNHVLTPGTIVTGRLLFIDSSTTPETMVVYGGDGSDMGLMISIGTTLTGGGKYIASAVAPLAVDVDDTTDLAAGDFGESIDLPGVTQIRAINTVEKGRSTHAIDEGTIVSARVLRFQTGGILVVSFTAYGIRVCPPPG